MRIGVYCEGMNNLSEMISHELGEHHEVINLKCLCRYYGGNPQPLKEKGMITPIFLLHPHDTNENKCYDKLSDLITKVPESHFYILALGDYERNEPRQKGIGQHPNVTYITEDNSIKVIQELMSL